MEIFVDGGLFELFAAVAFGYAVNYIFRNKYFLALFSGLAVLAPAMLFFVHTGELRYWTIGLCLLNAILLVVLLWRQRLHSPNQVLIDTEKLKRKFYNQQPGKRFAAFRQKLLHR